MKDLMKDLIKETKKDIRFDSILVVVGLLFAAGIHIEPLHRFICTSEWSCLISISHVIGGALISIGVLRLVVHISYLIDFKSSDVEYAKYTDLLKKYKIDHSYDEYGRYSYKEKTDYSSKCDEDQESDCGCLLWIIILLLLGAGK